MTLPSLLLGLLREPASGYDLKRLFEETLAHFWSARLSQIYPTLAQLEESGLVRVRSEDSPKGPPRKVYRLTRAGHRALREWLGTEPQIPPVRLGYLAQLFFMDEAEEKDGLPERHLKVLRAKNQERLELFRSIETAWSEISTGFPDNLPADEFHPYLTLRHGLLRYEATIRWIDESLARIRRRRKQDKRKDRGKGAGVGPITRRAAELRATKSKPVPS